MKKIACLAVLLCVGAHAQNAAFSPKPRLMFTMSGGVPTPASGSGAALSFMPDPFLCYGLNAQGQAAPCDLSGGGGGGTIPNTLNLIEGNDAGDGVDSGISAIDVPLLGATQNDFLGAASFGGTVSTTGNLNVQGLISSTQNTQPASITNSGVALSAAPSVADVLYFDATKTANNRTAESIFFQGCHSIRFKSDDQGTAITPFSACGGQGTGITGITSNSGSGSWAHTGNFSATGTGTFGNSTLPTSMTILGSANTTPTGVLSIVDSTTAAALNLGVTYFAAGLPTGGSEVLAIGKAPSTSNAAVFSWNQTATANTNNLCLSIWGQAANCVLRLFPTFLLQSKNITLDDGSGNMSIPTNGALSASPFLMTGAPITGGTATTTKPLALLEPTGTTSTGWSTLGTMLGVNALTGFSGNLIDLQLNGASRFAVGTVAGINTNLPYNSNNMVVGSNIKSGEAVVAFSATPSFTNTVQSSIITLTAALTSWTISNGNPGQSMTLTFCQNATGGFTTGTKPANVRGFMTIGMTASTCSTQSFVWSANQTAWLATSPGVINQ